MIFTKILLSLCAGFFTASYSASVMARSMGASKPNWAAICRLGVSLILAALVAAATWELSGLAMYRITPSAAGLGL